MINSSILVVTLAVQRLQSEQRTMFNLCLQLNDDTTTFIYTQFLTVGNNTKESKCRPPAKNT